MSSQLDTFGAGASTAPRFQASFTKAISAEVRTSSGQQRYLFRSLAAEQPSAIRSSPAECISLWPVCRADATVLQAEMQLQATFPVSVLHKHRLYVENGEPEPQACTRSGKAFITPIAPVCSYIRLTSRDGNKLACEL